MPKQDQKMHKFLVTIESRDCAQEIPMWGRTIEEALEAADLEYGEDNVRRIRPEVTQ
ncbi:RNA polymerase inhibitor [Pseudomonas phage vB_PpuP-Kompost-2]